MSQLCITHTDVTGTLMALYVRLPSLTVSDGLMPLFDKNWRAVLAILCSVPPTMPGLINSINPKIKVGGAVHLFDNAWIFGVSPLLTVIRYSTDIELVFLSNFFHETVHRRVYCVLHHFDTLPRQRDVP